MYDKDGNKIKNIADYLYNRSDKDGNIDMKKMIGVTIASNEKLNDYFKSNYPFLTMNYLGYKDYTSPKKTNVIWEIIKGYADPGTNILNKVLARI